MIKGERQYILSCLFAKNYLERWMIRNFERGAGRERKKTGGNKSLRQGKRRFGYKNMTGVGSLLEVCSTLII